MKILLTGGGTGGHITPLLAVSREIKSRDSSHQVIYIGERHSQFSEMTVSHNDFDETYQVWAGKFRRYHSESWIRRITDIATIAKNIRDLGYFFLGTLQSILLLRRVKPDVVLLKGGFVGVPVGLAAAFWRVPFITHDSDAMPGLANRIVSRWAKYHATALPAENYAYPPQKVKHVGVLIGEQYRPVTEKQQAEFKASIGIPTDARLVVVTGGSSGATGLNTIIKKIMPGLLSDYEDLYVVHQVGKGKTGIYRDFKHDRLIIKELLLPLYEYTGASDVVVSRAGANALAELGAQGRACVIVPGAHLTGGHQIKNAQVLADNGAVLVVEESTAIQDAEDLIQAIRSLIERPELRKKLGKTFQDITIIDATQKLTNVLIESAKKH